MDKIIVSGSSGFIGSHVIEQLNPFFDIIGIDRRDDGTIIQSRNVIYRKPQDMGYDAIRSLLRTNDVYAIVHLSAWSTVRDALRRPVELFDQNVMKTAQILQAVDDTPIAMRPKKIIFASSSAAKSPRESYYGISKFTCEEMLRVFERTTGVTTHSLRFGNVWGSRQNPKNGVLIAKLVEDAHRTWNGMPSRFVIFGTGDSRRFYVHVLDVVDAIRLALTTDDLPRVFNVSVEKDNSVNEVVAMASESCRKVFAVNLPTPTHVAPDPNDKVNCVLPTDPVLYSAGWNPKYPIITAEGIMEAMSWRRNADKDVFDILHNKDGVRL